VQVRVSFAPSVLAFRHHGRPVCLVVASLLARTVVSPLTHFHQITATMKLLSAVVALIAAGSAAAFAPAPLATRGSVSTQMAASEELYIDDERRFLMNLIMVGAGGVTVAAFGIPYILFFLPPGSGSGAGGIPAKDALGNDLFAKTYLQEKPAKDRSLAQGLKGDAT